MMPAEAPQSPLGAGSNAHPPGHCLTLLSCLRLVCDEVKIPPNTSGMGVRGAQHPVPPSPHLHSRGPPGLLAALRAPGRPRATAALAGQQEAVVHAGQARHLLTR